MEGGWPEPMPEEERRLITHMVSFDVWRDRALIETEKLQYMTALPDPTKIHSLVVEMDYRTVPRRVTITSKATYQDPDDVRKLEAIGEDAREETGIVVLAIIPGGNLEGLEGATATSRLFKFVRWPTD